MIKFVAPDAIRKRGEEVYDRAMWLSSVMDFESKAQPNIEKPWHRAEALIKELEELCREDLKKA